MSEVLFIHFNKASNPDRVLYPSDIKTAINEDYVSECRPYITLDSFDNLEAKNAELEKKLEIAVEALKFYQKQGKYHGFSRYMNNEETYYPAEIVADNGGTAREALAAIKGEGV